MKVPYAKKWRKETDKLRQIALDCYLTEELKWGKPCFTYQKKNVAIIIPLKDACAFSFFKGALLKDPKHVPQKIGEAQAGRWIKFTSPKEISALQATLSSYIYEAIGVEESGKKIPLKKASEYVVPEELQVRLNAAPGLNEAFEALLNHSRFGLNKQHQTERLLRAMNNRYFNILGHATGRLFLKRPGYELDIPCVIEHARQRGCFFEINSSPERLDLSGENAHAAVQERVKLAISTDAHGTREFGLVRYGLDQACRADLNKDDVLNCQAWSSLRRLLKR